MAIYCEVIGVFSTCYISKVRLARTKWDTINLATLEFAVDYLISVEPELGPGEVNVTVVYNVVLIGGIKVRRQLSFMSRCPEMKRKGTRQFVIGKVAQAANTDDVRLKEVFA